MSEFLESLYAIASNKPSPELWQRFWSKVAVGADNDCWLWQAGQGTKGYGLIRIAGRNHGSHRLIWIWLSGDLPTRLVIDHRVCSVKLCVNPLHTIPHTSQFNNIRPGTNNAAALNARKTHCKYGHELTPDNVYVWPSAKAKRTCRTCHLAWRKQKDKGRKRQYNPDKERVKTSHSETI